MELRDALAFVRRWILALVLVPVLAALAGYLVVSRMTPVYEATTLLEIGSGVPGAGNLDPGTVQQLAGTYASVMKTRAVLGPAAQQAGISASFADLQKRVSVSPVLETQVLKIAADDANPQHAAQLANAVANVFMATNAQTQAAQIAASRANLERLISSLQADVDQRTAAIQQLQTQPASPANATQLTQLMRDLGQRQGAYNAAVQSYNQLGLTQASSTNTLRVVEPATAPLTPVRPNEVLVIVMCALIGLVAAVGLGAALDHLDDSLPDGAAVRRATGLSVLGSLSRDNPDGSNGGLAGGQAVGDYRLLVSHLLAAMAEKPLDSVAVTSAEDREGKSTVAANLARSLAESGRRVILVDANFHQPAQAALFGLRDGLGFSDLLVDPALRLADVVQPTDLPGLDLLSSGAVGPESAAFLSSPRLFSRLTELHRRWDVVVFDTPSLLAQPDAALLGRQVGTVLLVADARRSHGRPVSRALEMLRGAGASVVGVALNRGRKPNRAGRSRAEIARPASRVKAAAVEPVAPLGSPASEPMA